MGKPINAEIIKTQKHAIPVRNAIFTSSALVIPCVRDTKIAEFPTGFVIAKSVTNSDIAADNMFVSKN